MGWQLFITFGAAFIGSILGPSFLYWLQKRGRKEEVNLQHLNDVYKLAKDMECYSKRFSVHVILAIAMKKGFVKVGLNIPMKHDEHITALIELLDYHLEPPEELINKIKDYPNPYKEAHMLLAKRFEPREDLKKNIGLALGDALQVEKCFREVCFEVCSWAKSEKERIENQPSIFGCWLEKIRESQWIYL